MSGPDQGPSPDGPDPERLYVVTGGRTGDGRKKIIDLVTLIVARSGPLPTTAPEAAVVLRLCSSPLSVAEISAYLSAPVSVVNVLLSDLLAEELVEARAPVPRALLPERALIEAVMHGLQKL